MNDRMNILLIYRMRGVYEVTFLLSRINEEVHYRVIRSQLEQVLASHPDAMLLLDFREVRYLTSAMLGILVSLSRKAQETGGRFRLCGLRPEIRELFAITGLDRVMEISPSRREGAFAFAEESAGNRMVA